MPGTINPLALLALAVAEGSGGVQGQASSCERACLPLHITLSSTIARQ